MSRRRKSRQVAIQMLYQIDLNADLDIGVVRDMIRERISDQQLQNFCDSLFLGVMENRAEIDEALQQVAHNWRLNRMAATDRAVLRLGAFELLKTDTPRGVIIDEAIELSKKFGDANSPQFVNGVLDKLGKRE